MGFGMNALWVQLLGYLAGAVVMCAALPQIVQNIRRPQDALRQSLWRNILFVAGNMIWVIYGVQVRATPIIVMCAINVTLNTVLLVQVLRSPEPPASSS
jgi:uncharacterized protein with PQ loop repeat